MKKLLLIFFVLFFGIESCYAQHLSNLPEKERNEKLIRAAKQVFKTWDGGRYKDYIKYGIPEVERYETKSEFFTGVNKKMLGKYGIGSFSSTRKMTLVSSKD